MHRKGIVLISIAALCIHSAEQEKRLREGSSTATPAGIDKFFEEEFYPAAEGKEPPPVTPELIARLMAASARHGQTILRPAHS